MYLMLIGYRSFEVRLNLTISLPDSFDVIWLLHQEVRIDLYSTLGLDRQSELL